MGGKRVLCFVLFITIVSSGSAFELLCHHSNGPFSGGEKDAVVGQLSEDGAEISCNKTTRHMVCVAVWKRLSNDSLPSSVQLTKQTCMLMNEDFCQQRNCSRAFRTGSQMEYCCCVGRLCNTRVHLAAVSGRPRPDDLFAVPDDAPPDTAASPPARFTSGHLAGVLGLMAGGVVFAAVATLVVTLLRRRRAARKASAATQPLRLRRANPRASASEESCGTASTRLVSRCSQGKLLGDFSRLQLLDLIHRGKYGEVWRARLADGEFCVKMFARGPQQQYFHNERDVYAMPMNAGHHNILPLVGWDVRPADGTAMLVLELCPAGSLHDFLAQNTVDWAAFLRLGMGAAAGLAHLHSEFGVPGVTRSLVQEVTWPPGARKCPIVHRDVNSRNMVVRADGTLLISDMGFAVKLAPGGNRYYNRDNEPENAEESPLQEVGTVRYMAPEVLEGFVNLRECEASLKQVDVYALALVLWELATRCHALCPDGQPASYAEPYWAEVGPQPDVARLTDAVVKQKVRPKLPADWPLTEMPHRLLHDTLDESWDADQEARLSAACVLERLKSLSRDWRQAGDGAPLLQQRPESAERAVAFNIGE